MRIDDVVVNAFGQTRYRLASDINLLHWRAISLETYLQSFVGGAGYYVSDVELPGLRELLDVVHLAVTSREPGEPGPGCFLPGGLLGA